MLQGTGEEVRLNIASADLALMRGDVEQALSMLRSVGPQQHYYLQARDKMASIYLNNLKDKRMFASCYRCVHVESISYCIAKNANQRNW